MSLLNNSGKCEASFIFILNIICVRSVFSWDLCYIFSKSKLFVAVYRINIRQLGIKPSGTVESKQRLLAFFPAECLLTKSGTGNTLRSFLPGELKSTRKETSGCRNSEI